MPTRRCCCGSAACPHFCMPNGGSLCPTESTRSYVAQPQDGTTYLGTGDPVDICCSELFDWIHGEGGEWENRSFGLENDDDNTDCIWLTPEFEDCDGGTGLGTLVIASDTEATLTITIGSATLVWTADPGYDPLCISSFTYDADLSDPPDDCSWPEKFCVIPSESCCPDYGYPDTLYATVVVTRALGACADWTSGTKVIELTRVTPTDPDYYPGSVTAAVWVGSDELWPGGSVLAIEMACVRHPGEAFVMDMQFPLTGCAPDGQYADETPITGFGSCNPFIFTFTDVQNIDSCCTGGFEFDITVTE